MDMALAWKRLDGENAHDAGLALLEQLYGNFLPPILRTPQGKPYFPENDLHFSISHTPKHAFCVLADRPVGLDAEECDRPVQPALARKFLSPQEFARYEAAPDPRGCLLRLWVLKEAYAKLTGRGIGNYLKNTDFHPDDPRIQIIDGCYVAVLEEGENYAL
jgi:4'-phosphopantetheinyl transferase